MAVSVRVTATAEAAIADLRKLDRDVRTKVLDDATRAIAEDIVKRAKALAPIRTGRLRRSIRAARRFRVVRAGAPYAPFVEGPPLNRRFLRRAVEQVEARADRHVERALNRATK